MEYPYCIIDDVKNYPEETDAAKRERMRMRIGAAIGDEEALARILGVVPPEFEDFYGDSSAPGLSTEDTIDAFLGQFGSKAGYQADPLQFAPAVDYATMLEIEEKKESESQNSKMSETETAEIAPETDKKLLSEPSTEAQKTAEDTSLSESFAQILIKNRKYSKALEILSQISLNNPEKSVYFADQIRFLRKVVYNENKQKH